MTGPRRLRIELVPSTVLALLMVLAHLAAGASAALVIPGAAGMALGAALVALGAAAAWGRALLRSRASVRALELDGATSGLLELASGERFKAEFGARRYVSRFFVSLPVVRPMRRTILIFRDMAGPDSFRRLRLWALWGRVSVAGKQLAS